MDISAVVVTFNRIELLKVLMDRLTSFPLLSRIILVDNASSDGTLEYGQSIYEHGVVYFRSDVNLGGAGGFAKGVELALTFKSDFIFLMDDDGLPDFFCLEEMIKCSTELDILNPLVVNIEDEGQLAFGLEPGISRVSDLLELDSDIVYGSMNPFNGTLVRRKVFDQMGNIKREMFIWGDEVEFLLRARTFGFSFGTVVSARLFHPKSKSSYTKFLKRFLIEEKPRKLIGNLYRNNAYIKRRYHGTWSALKFFFVYFLFYISKREYKLIITFVRYFFDGFTNRFKLPPILEK